jgi:hypothetical protein
VEFEKRRLEGESQDKLGSGGLVDKKALGEANKRQKKE